MERTSYFAARPVALVVGCGDIGMGCARQLGARDPLLIIDIDAERLMHQVDTLRAEGFTVTGQQCDIGDAKSVAALGEFLAGTSGVRVLAHVAAVGPTIGDWRRMMTINLLGPHRIAAAVRPHMVRGGVALFVASGGGHIPSIEARDRVLAEPLAPGFFDALVEALGGEPDLLQTYSYAKRALIDFAKRCAVEWGADEIRSLSISPGMIHTTMGRRDGALSPDRAKMVANVPLSREGTVNEVAAVLAFLASDAASFVNGIDLLIDGGQQATFKTQKRTRS